MMYTAFGVYLFATFATGRALNRECGHPPVIENADFNVIDNPPYPEGTNVSYACKEGFEREGRITYTCSNGDWGVDLICNQIRCETLRDPENGFIVNPQRFVPVVTINLECNPGYTLQGPASRTCLIDGQWRPSDPPTCQIKNCGPFSEVANAAVFQDTFSSEANVYGQNVTITCNTGFVLNGRRVSPCQASGEWELPAPTCETSDCGSHPGANGTCVSKTLLTSSTLYMTCTEHSTIIGGNGGATDCNLNTKTWDDLNFSCKCDCEIPSSPGAVFNNVVDGYIKHDAVLDWRCSTGTMSTSEVLRCQDGVIKKPACLNVPASPQTTAKVTTDNPDITKGSPKVPCLTPETMIDGEKENFDNRYLLFILLLLLLPLGVGAYCKREKIKDVCSCHKSDTEAKKTDPEAGESCIDPNQNKANSLGNPEHPAEDGLKQPTEGYKSDDIKKVLMDATVVEFDGKKAEVKIFKQENLSASDENTL